MQSHFSFAQPAALATAGTLAAACLASSAAQASMLDDSGFYIAYGVDNRQDAGIGSNPFKNSITVSDLHGDHYHVFNINNGTSPTGHTPMPITVDPKSDAKNGLQLAARNISPYPGEYTIPETPAGDFKLVAVNVPEGLDVLFAHHEHWHTMDTGSQESLSLDELHELAFVADENLALGEHQIDFKIVDDAGHYIDSVTYASFVIDSNFSILVNVVPEPAGLGLAGLPATLLLRRRRKG